jgi:hypothetical protein
MIRRNTWILLIVLVLLIGATFYLNNQKKTSASSATPTPSQKFLFSPQDGNPTDIKIQDTIGNSVEIALNATGSWVLKAPTAQPADQSKAEAAATQLTSLNLLGNVQLDLNVVGLDKPTYTMTITFDSAKTHKVLIGSVNPIQTGYYVQLDSGPVQIADETGINSLIGMLSAPPYVATSTPATTLTPASSDTPTALPTETPSVVTTSTPISGTAVSTTPTP